MGKHISKLAAADALGSHKNLFKVFTAPILMAALMMASLAPARPLAAEETPLDCLVLNDGGSLALRMEQNDPTRLYIESGTAVRVPRKERIPCDIGRKIVELDIGTKVFSLDTGARQITLSGPSYATISGIDAEDWGSDDCPAVFMDRDCRLVLLGKAR